MPTKVIVDTHDLKVEAKWDDVRFATVRHGKWSDELPQVTVFNPKEALILKESLAEFIREQEVKGV